MDPFPQKIIRFKEVGSTNDLAMEFAKKGCPHGTVVIADSQRKGRGRLGRKWQSPVGANIYMSIILRPGIQPKGAALLTLLSSVAAASALRKLTGVDVSIKWPNDLMASGKKLGGILLEGGARQKIPFVVVGIGINVNMLPEGFPMYIRPIATSLLKETGRRHKRTVLMEGILNEMDKGLKSLKRGPAPLLKKWRGLTSTLGRKVKVIMGSKTLTGLAEDIDGEGRLIIKMRDGSLKTVSTGDVLVL